MKIEAFLLCDAATDYHGKLNVLGAFDCIFSKKMPTVHPACAVVLRLRFSRIEEGNHKIKINFINEDGKMIIPSLDQTIVVRFRHGFDSTAANLVINLQGVKFDSFGEYRIDLAIDNREEASLPFYVRQIPEKPSPK